MWLRLLSVVGVCVLGGSSVMAQTSGFVDRFKTVGGDWYVAEYDFDHDKFDTDWRADQVRTAYRPDGTGLELRLSPHTAGINRFAGGSVRREEVSHYGRYETTLRAASHPGVVTGFFTYTGPHYGTQHDEIDIEFLGRNTRQMHVAWFVDGKLENRYIDLGFDAAERMATYAFEWCPDKLRWFADGRLIFEHDADQAPIPHVPGRLFVNLWAADPSISGWAGFADADTQTRAEIGEVRFTPMETTHYQGKRDTGSISHQSGAGAHDTCGVADK